MRNRARKQKNGRGFAASSMKVWVHTIFKMI